jgi:SH3-like domain-containing protein
MPTINKFYLILIILSFSYFEKSFAKESFKFLSLKNSEVNLRQGPSFKYPIKLTYKKKYLPIIIIDRSDTWRKIKDFENNSGWIHISQLTKKRSAINIKKDSIVYKKSTLYSKPMVRLEIGRLVIIKKCQDKWCKIVTGNISGWVLKKTLWGMV